jgi:hypothetical protein
MEPIKRIAALDVAQFAGEVAVGNNNVYLVKVVPSTSSVDTGDEDNDS